MAKENASHSVGSTRNRAPPGSVTSVSSTTTPTCDRADSAKTSTRMLTIPTTGSALVDSKTSRTADSASSVNRLIPAENLQEVKEAPDSHGRASVVTAMPEVAERSPRIGTVPAVELVTSPSVAVASNVPRPIPMEALATIGNVPIAAFPTSPVDIRASSARNRIPTEAVMEVVSARASEEVAEEVVVEAVAVEAVAVAEVVAVEVASEAVLEEAVAIGVFREEMIPRTRTKRLLLTSRVL